MALKDRIKSKQDDMEDEKSYSGCSYDDDSKEYEFTIPIAELTKKVMTIKDNAALGAITKEFAKFLNSISDDEAHLSLKGNFDIGKKTLITCLLASIYEEETEGKTSSRLDKVEVDDDSPTLIKKRKNLKEKLKGKKD